MKSKVMAGNGKQTAQSKLIGEHPSSGLFFDWFECEDTPATDQKKHRKLTNKGINKATLVDHLSQWILKHHTTDARLARIGKKKQILDKHGFAQYMDGKVPFPIKSATTQKGNLGEIILAEYLTASTGLEILVYKLRYNPNVEQSMKGDDLLLFEKNSIQSKVIMGEAKFRTTKSKKALDDIVDSLSNKNLPISLAFVSDRLDEMGEIGLADEIDDLISNLHSNKTPITYVGFYHSEATAYTTIEKNLNSNNKNLVVVSYGENDPEQLIKDSFDEALRMVVE
ncbi:TPA: Hachiman antiphage defense system protein HamA [Photobacterium damselae]